MVGKGSPRFNMSSSPKLRRYMPTTNASKKKPSPKCSGAKKSGGSPRVKQRANWNPALEWSLVDILHECEDSGYRGDNGWNSEGWNKMAKELHLRNKDYKMLKAAKQQSGSSWNEKRNMVEEPPAMWTNLMVKFNNKATFPLFDALRELYDGHLAEGIYNVTSPETLQEEEPPEQLQDAEDEPQGFDDNVVHEVNDEAGDGTERNEEGLQGMADTLSRDEENDAPAIERKKELKRPRKNENIVGMMGAYLEMRTKQADAEAGVADRAKEMEERERETREREAREKDAAQASDFWIRRCISILNTMKMMKEEKIKVYAIFIKSKENREAFICVCEVDQELALIWLRSEMA
ncbi:hypothetical protein GQ55_8G144500 [Panicum hallii var. hallii]|uniref:Myb/SANT-like domain-containing protein n=1 Tax=Panicum hallii var. hallii TaxID=1504633 RepID=A0A2T7CN20_9POAL|nr:hypothetical protein GQ55_8G144500 [Panicum hallii var. hallii]